MGNTLFRFKKFSISQQTIPFKVGTDGVLLGAWADCSNVKRVLDVGTGTGILALMIAQRNTSCLVDAIEIDTSGAVEIQNNISHSPWADRISLYFISWEDYASDCLEKYDLVVCNPPYFNNSLLPEKKERVLSRHDVSLNLTSIFMHCNKLISENGSLSMVFPESRLNEIVTTANNHGFSLHEVVFVSGRKGKLPERVLTTFRRNVYPTRESYLYIESGGRHKFSSEYIELTKEFYLDF